MRNLIRIIEAASKKLSQTKLADHFIDPHLYDKIGTVKARLAKLGEKIETIIDDEVETANTAKKGDVVVKGVQDEEYILTEKKFLDRYTGPELEDSYQEYEATGTTYAVKWSGGSASFDASWGEEMIIHDGDWLCSITKKPDGDLYRVEAKAFKKSYHESSEKK